MKTGGDTAQIIPLRVFPFVIGRHLMDYGFSPDT